MGRLHQFYSITKEEIPQMKLKRMKARMINPENPGL